MSSRPNERGREVEAINRGITDPRSFEVPTPCELRELRILAGLSQREVAAQLDVDKDSIWRWEQGHRSPRLCDVRDMLECYCNHFDGQSQLPKQ